LEIHVALSRAESYESPDLALFDIDPEPPAIFDDAVDVALIIEDRLDHLGLKSYIKTSGKKGLHIVVPVSAGYTFEQTREFVHRIGKSLASGSKIIVSELSDSKKPGTVFIDYLQNSHGRTMACPYSLRATPHATVSTPLDWSDLKKGIKPETLNILTVAKNSKSPWQDLMKNRQSLV